MEFETGAAIRNREKEVRNRTVNIIRFLGGKSTLFVLVSILLLD